MNRHNIIIQHAPSTPWLHGAHEGDHVWLPKEKELALINGDYVQPLEGHIGSITIQRMTFNRKLNKWSILTKIEEWYTSATGRGVDGSLILCQILGNSKTAIEVVELRPVESKFEII